MASVRYKRCSRTLCRCPFSLSSRPKRRICLDTFSPLRVSVLPNWCLVLQTIFPLLLFTPKTASRGTYPTHNMASDRTFSPPSASLKSSVRREVASVAPIVRAERTKRSATIVIARSSALDQLERACVEPYSFLRSHSKLTLSTSSNSLVVRPPASTDSMSRIHAHH